MPGDAGAPAYGVAIRLGFGLLKGFRREVAEELCEERDRHGPFTSVADCLRRVRSFDGLSAERLIRAGAFDGVAPKRRRWLLWRLPEWLELRGGVLPGPLGEVAVGAAVADAEPADQGAVADLPLAVKLADEYNLLGVGISSHWMNLLRPELAASGYRTVREVLEWPDGAFVRTAGLLIRPHRPPTKSGRTVVFFTLEDETGLVDATMFEPVYRACGAVVFTPYGRLLGVEGRVERRGGSRAQIVVSRVWPLAGEPADDDFGEMLQENRSSARRVEF
ncbi:MAG: hypothetical protein IRZ33_11930 [Alicyclobacillaceae bacterium]|nr:hypothetical protein [Alicyclobacillaceae bacterium]